MDKKEAKIILRDMFTLEWKHQRHYFHKDTYVRYELLAEEYEALKVLVGNYEQMNQKKSCKCCKEKLFYNVELNTEYCISCLYYPQRCDRGHKI